MKKRKGSSLIIVIIIMAILFTTGSAILTLTASDYKMRTNASKKLENFYAANSGLDIVENIILKNSEAAIIYANKKIKEKYDGQEMTKELYEKINVDFKVEFINFLGKEALGNGKINTDAILAQGIINGKYKVLNEVGDGFIWKEYIDKKPEIEIIEYKYDATKDTIFIEVKSFFETIDREIKNKKVLTTKYTVGSPDYKAPISSDSVLIDIYPVFDGKIITTDGNLTLTGTAEVKGDIWVKGDSELGDNPAYAFDKYRGGISVENGEVKLEGNIVTNRTLHLKNSSKAIITGDVYALNTYVGKSDKTGISKDNELQINEKNNIGGNLIVNNDLALNATNSNVSMNNFYGINDKTDDSLTDISKAMKSSSIIVNDMSDTSKLTVTNDTYIMGVAYIDTLGDKYQTGESVAVKGNYQAYSDILPGYEDKVTLKYYNPLQLIETIDGETKASYFQKYYEANNASLRNGGVYLNKDKIYSTGAYVTKNKDASSSVGNKVIDVANIRSKRNDFARNVFSMGHANVTEGDLYTAGIVSKTVKTQIDFTKALSTTSVNETYGKLKLNNDENKIIVIKGKDDIKTYDNSKYTVIDASEALKAVIITNGKVIVTGEVDFTGNIIAEENVEFIDNKNKKLTYDANITRKIIAANYNVLEDVLKKGTPIGQKAEIVIGDKVNIDITADGYNLKGLLKTSNWKIVK